MKRGDVGVDIATGGVRVAVTHTRRDGAVEVRKLVTATLPEGALTAGVITDPEAVAAALRAALKQAGASREGFVLAYRSPRVVVGAVQAAGLAANEVHRFVRDNGIEISPVVKLATAVLSSANPTPDAAGEVVLAAADAAEVLSLRAMLKAAKATPRAVDLAGAAVLRACTIASDNDTTRVALVDIGAATTTIALRHGRALRAVRTLDVGTDALTQAVLEATYGPADPRPADAWAQAEALKAALSVRPVVGAYGEPADPTLVDDPQRVALNEAADALIITIAETIDSLARANGGEPVAGAVLLGGGSLQRGLPARFSAAVGAPSAAGKPWALLSTKTNTGSDLPDAALLTTYASAIGAAQWKCAGTPRTSRGRRGDISLGDFTPFAAFDLLDGEYATRASGRRFAIALTGVVSIAAAAVLGVGFLARADASSTAETARVQTLTAAKTVAAAEKAAKLGNLTRRQLESALGGRLSVINAALDGGVDYAALTGAVAGVAGGVTVTSLTVVTFDRLGTTPPAAGAKPTAGTKPVAAQPTPSVGSVSIQGTGTSYAAVLAYSAAATKLPMLIGAKTLYTGAPPAVTFTTTAQLSPEARSSRAAHLMAGLAVLPPSQTPKPTATTPGSHK